MDLDKHRDARLWREVKEQIIRLPQLSFRKIKSHQKHPPPERFAAMCWAGNAKTDKMVAQQLQQMPPIYRALEHDIAQWKRFLVLHAMIAEIRYADTTDTDDPQQLVWENEPPQPTPAKGPWPTWLNELVLRALQRVPDFQATMHAADNAQQPPRPSARPQHMPMPIRKFPYPPVAHASHRMQ
eukprot:6365983-Amphidinium_carterae.1